jgi:hypothetical protein
MSTYQSSHRPDKERNPAMTEPVPTALVDPERQFMGCLIQQSVAPARRLIAGLGSDDFADPTCGWALALAVRVLSAGQAPGPVALLDCAWDTTSAAPRTGGADRLARLGVWLVDTYRDTTHASEDHAAWLKTVVLKQAWRRAVAEHSTRVLQAVEQRATDELLRIYGDRDRTDGLWRRYLGAAESAQRSQPTTDEVTERSAA